MKREQRLHLAYYDPYGNQIEHLLGYDQLDSNLILEYNEICLFILLGIDLNSVPRMPSVSTTCAISSASLAVMGLNRLGGTAIGLAGNSYYRIIWESHINVLDKCYITHGLKDI